MCQALPSRVVRIDGDRAWVEGSETSVSLLGVDGMAVGDFIVHHTRLALGGRVRRGGRYQEGFRKLGHPMRKTTVERHKKHIQEPSHSLLTVCSRSVQAENSR